MLIPKNCTLEYLSNMYMYIGLSPAKQTTSKLFQADIIFRNSVCNTFCTCAFNVSKSTVCIVPYDVLV